MLVYNLIKLAFAVVLICCLPLIAIGIFKFAYFFLDVVLFKSGFGLLIAGFIVVVFVCIQAGVNVAKGNDHWNR